MKIFNSVLFSIILPAIIAADDGQASVVLNKNNYHDKLAQGLWFVKFYAPWCKFSKRLAPTWTKFTEAQKDLTKKYNIHFGEVDCQANGDLCNDFKIDGYPTLLLQNSEGTIEEYMDGQSESELADYAQNQAKDYKEEKPKTSSNIEAQPKQQSEALNSKEIQTPDASKVIAENDSYDYPSTTGSVKEINDKNFKQAIDTKATWIMEFFNPSCPHCQKMAPIFKNLAEAYKDKVNFGKIDCSQLIDLCTIEGTKGVPYFKIYYKGESKSDFAGEMPLEKLRELVQNYTTPTFTELKSNEITSKKSEIDPTLVFLGGEKDDKDYKTKFEEKMIGLDILGTVVYSKDKELKSSLSGDLQKTPTIFMISKDGTFEYTGDLEDFNTLKSWVNIHKYPLDYQITSSILTQVVQKYIVVLKLSDSEDASEDLTKAAKQYREDSNSINTTPVLFGHGITALADTLYLLGVPKPSSFPYTVIIKSENSVYFDKGESGDAIQLDSEHMIPILHAVQKNAIQGQNLVPKAGSFIRDHFYVVIFGILGASIVGYLIYKKRSGGFQYSKVE